MAMKIGKPWASQVKRKEGRYTCGDIRTETHLLDTTNTKERPWSAALGTRARVPVALETKSIVFARVHWRQHPKHVTHTQRVSNNVVHLHEAYVYAIQQKSRVFSRHLTLVRLRSTGLPSKNLPSFSALEVSSILKLHWEYHDPFKVL